LFIYAGARESQLCHIAGHETSLNTVTAYWLNMLRCGGRILIKKTVGMWTIYCQKTGDRVSQQDLQKTNSRQLLWKLWTHWSAKVVSNCRQHCHSCNFVSWNVTQLWCHQASKLEFITISTGRQKLTNFVQEMADLCSETTVAHFCTTQCTEWSRKKI